MRLTGSNSNFTNQELLACIKKGDEHSLEVLIDRFSKKLCVYAFQFTKSKDFAEEIVADVFIKLWQKRNELDITTSLKGFLYKSAYNRTFDLLRNEKRFANHEEISGLSDMPSIQPGPEGLLNLEELRLEIESLISRMPAQRQLIFRLNRIDGLKYREIAESLSISTHTVQNQMVEAIKFMSAHFSKMESSLIVLLFLQCVVMVTHY
ncbi:MAG TPA: RNA polymerase sigma-70 factor [Flavitalea sp.]|nr:RNA polymerase sigma-70 factor [Flavitalea sp.]